MSKLRDDLGAWLVFAFFTLIGALCLMGVLGLVALIWKDVLS